MIGKMFGCRLKRSTNIDIARIAKEGTILKKITHFIEL